MAGVFRADRTAPREEENEGMAKRKSLSTLMAEDMTRKIMDGTLEPGSRLPTEAELCEQYEVSRTVVREAVARMRSDGLLESHQGRGMFVSERMPAQKFEIDETSLTSLPETISLLELRLSVEVEAAALCAQRRTDAEACEIRQLMERVDSHQSDPATVEIHYDFSFHLRIAQATKNPFFLSFLTFLEPIIVPRYRLSTLVTKSLQDSYYDQIHAEHEAIVVAIENKDPVKARQAMRAHLLSSLDRMRALSHAAGVRDGIAMEDPEAQQLLTKILSEILPDRAQG